MHYIKNPLCDKSSPFDLEILCLCFLMPIVFFFKKKISSYRQTCPTIDFSYVKLFTFLMLKTKWLEIWLINYFSYVCCLWNNKPDWSFLKNILVIFFVIFSSGNAFPNADVNAVMNSGQNPEVLNTPSSHDQKPPVIPQNAPQSYSPSTESRNSSSRKPGKIKYR